MRSLKGQIEEEWFVGVMAPHDLLHSGWIEGTLEGVKLFKVCFSVCMNLNLFPDAHLSM